MKSLTKAMLVSLLAIPISVHGYEFNSAGENISVYLLQDPATGQWVREMSWNNSKAPTFFSRERLREIFRYTEYQYETFSSGLDVRFPFTSQPVIDNNNCVGGFVDEKNMVQASTGPVAGQAEVKSGGGCDFFINRDIPHWATDGAHENFVSLFMHEFGHLAGLSHPDIGSSSEERRSHPNRLAMLSSISVGPPPPPVGNFQENTVLSSILTLDDRIGLNTLYPVDPDRPNFVRTEPMIMTSNRDDNLNIYLPVVDIGGGQEVFAHLLYIGIVDGQHQWWLYQWGAVDDIVDNPDQYTWSSVQKYEAGVLTVTDTLDTLGNDTFRDMTARFELVDPTAPVKDWRFALIE